MKRTLLVLTAYAGLAGGATVFDPDAASADSGIAKMHEQTATFVVEKMTCALCPITVRKAMQGVDGVNSVSIDLGTKAATVRFDPDVTNAQRIAEASAQAGYPVLSTAVDQ